MPETQPRVNIGLPVFNGARYIAGTVESFLAQTFADFELIVSDNASTDETEAICRSYATRDARIRYLRQPFNRGGMWNFNEVFRHNRAVYFKWAASDDLCAPTFLARCVAILDRRPEIVWCYTQAGKIDAAGHRMTADPERGLGPIGWVHSTQAGLPRQDHDSPRPHRRFRGVLLGTNWSVDFFGLIRAEVLGRTHLLPLCYGGEKVLTAELALHGPSYEIPETLFFTRVHPSSSGSDHSAAAQRRFNAPAARRGNEFTRLKLLAGYVRAVRGANLPPLEHAHCWFAIARYLLQFRKWLRVLSSLCTGGGVGNAKATVVQVTS